MDGDYTSTGLWCACHWALNFLVQESGTGQWEHGEQGVGVVVVMWVKLAH